MSFSTASSVDRLGTTFAWVDAASLQLAVPVPVVLKLAAVHVHLKTSAVFSGTNEMTVFVPLQSCANCVSGL